MKQRVTIRAKNLTEAKEIRMETLLAAIILLLIVAQSSVGAPIGKDRDKFKLSLKELRQPINKLRKMTETYEFHYVKQQEQAYPDIKNSRFFQTEEDRKLKQKCEKEFANKLHDKAFISGMKIFQDLVRISQDLQLSESAINNGDETQFVTDFRQLEYDLRNLVEDTMRKQAFDVLDDEYAKEVPPYSVGGVDFKSFTKEKLLTLMRNVNKIVNIRQCLRQFEIKLIDALVGKPE